MLCIIWQVDQNQEVLLTLFNIIFSISSLAGPAPTKFEILHDRMKHGFQLLAKRDRFDSLDKIKA